MKSVLFILMDLSGGGAEKVLIDILHHTNFSCYNIDLLLIIEKGVYLNDVPKSVNVLRIYKNNGLRFKLDFFFSRYLGIDYFQRCLIRKRVTKQYDAVVSFMEGIPLKFHKYLINCTNRNVTWVHTDINRLHYTLKYLRKNEEKRLYEAMDCVAVVSEQAKIGFCKEYIINTPLYTMYNPIDREKICLLADSMIIEKRKFTICCVGRITYVKRYDRIIRVMYRLLQNGYDTELWILGCGDLEKQCRKLCKELNIENNVRFFGFLINPYPYVKASDIFVSTSMTEGYPLSICEALCLDKPIVATNVTGPREILGDSEYGLLTEENDNDIYNAIRRMIDDSTLRQYYMKKSSERKRIFEMQMVVDKIYSLIFSNQKSE